MKMKNLKKKALAFAGVLALLGAGAVFGQDEGTDETAAPAGLDVGGGKLTIGAYVNTGVRFDSQTIKDVSPTYDGTSNYVRPYAADVNNSGRVKFTLGWTSGDSTYGANIMFRANDIFYDLTQGMLPGTTLLQNQFVSYYAYGWYKPIQYFSVSGGIVDDGAFATEGDYADYALDNVYGPSPGGMLHITPFDILDVGFGVFAPQNKVAQDAGPNTIYYAGLAVNTSAFNLRGSAVFQDELQNALFSVSTGLINNLTLALEGSVFASGIDDAKYGFWGDLNTAYSAGDLGISLVAYYYANNYDKGLNAYDNWYSLVYNTSSDYMADSTTPIMTVPIDITVMPGVTYSLLGGKVVPGLKFLVGYGKNTKSEESLFRIQPQIYVGFPIGNGQITAGYELTNDSKTPKVGDKQNILTHTIDLDFLYKY